MSSPGPHVFLLVIKLGVRFTEEERDTVKWIQENFGKEALCRTIILFTHADQLMGKPVEDFINKSKCLMEIVNNFGGRYHSFNNEDRNHEDQVTELLKKINSVIQENEMNHYTLKMFKSNQKSKKVKIACAIAMLGIGFLGTVKIAGKIAAAITGRAAGEAVEKAAVAAGEGAVSAVEAVQSLVEKTADTAGEAVQAVAEKVADTAGEAVQPVAKKVADTAGEAVQAVAEKVVDTAGEAVETVATKAGVATGTVSLAVAAVAAAAARYAAIAGKLASGRVSAITALAAVVAGGAAAALSVAKP
ncbi:hypothetical protein QQF64_000345 [Cirrhinus molitorella]|uniref:AIG1-type G domain-containing protein n=1 Tax=Cirrhinus molitorella TaxID=172907 RepID=A0ABR3NXH3_9TELE